MAMRIFRTIVVCAVVLFLGSCEVLEFIFGSVFPATLMLAKAQVDLSGKIDSGEGDSFNVRVVEAGSNRYVVVEGSLPTDERAFFFYDLDLKHMRTLTLPSTSGNGVMVDAGGDINAGGTLLDPANLSTVGTGTVVSYNGSAGIDGFVASGSNITGFYIQSGTSTLSYSVNGSLYSPLPTLSATMSNLGIDAVLDDGDTAGNVILVVSQSGGGDDATRYFVTIQKTYFTSTVPNNLLDSAKSRDKLERDSLGFADGSIMAYDRGSSRYVRIDPTDASTQDSLYSVRPQQSRFAYRISGGDFYGFDTKSRVLTKYAAWW